MPQIDLDEFKIRRHKDSGEASPNKGSTQLELEAIDITPRPNQIRTRDADPADERPDVLTEQVRLPYGPLRQLNPAELSLKWQLMEQLAKSLPLNEFDLPIYVYRPDMLDHNALRSLLQAVHTSSSDESTSTEGSTTPTIHSHPQMRAAEISYAQSMLDSATVPLTYYEGFPVAPNGLPFWEKLPYEPKQSYDAFIYYLEMGGARQIHLLSAYDLGDLKDWFHSYMWAFRVRAFDLFRLANAQKIRLHRMLATEDSHFLMAEKLIKKVNQHLDTGTNFEDKIAELDLDKIVAVLDKLVKVQRISVGLAAQGGIDPEMKPRKDPSVQITMQQITNDGSQRKADSSDFDLLQDDPDSIELAQELIIKTQKAGNLSREEDDKVKIPYNSNQSPR